MYKRQRQTVDYLRALLLIQMGGNDTLIDLPAEMLRDMAQQARRFEPASLLRAIRLFNQAAVDLRGNLQGVPQLALELAVVEAALDGADKPLAANISEQAASAATPVRAIPASAAAPVLTRTAGESQVVEAAGRPIVIERPAATTSMPPTSVGPTPSPSASDAQASEVDKLGLLRQNWARVKELLQDRRRMLLGILTGGVRFLAIEQSEVIIGYDLSLIHI